MSKNLFSDDSDDYAVINGCHIHFVRCVGVPIILRRSDQDYMTISLQDQIIIIDRISWSDIEALDVMLEALSRYASLINARGIVSNPNLPMETMAILDQNGVLDRWYGQPQENRGGRNKMPKDTNYTPNMVKIMKEKGRSKMGKNRISIFMSDDTGITYSIMDDAIVIEGVSYKDPGDLYRLFDCLGADIEEFNIDRIYCRSRFPLSFAKLLDACLGLDGIVE